MMQSGKFDVGAFIGRNSKQIRWPEIESCARALKREHGFEKVGAMGFCFGGWAVFRLGGKGMCSVKHFAFVISYMCVD